MNDLMKKHCVPCEGGMPPLSNKKEDEFVSQVADWVLVRDGTHRITRQFKFKDFRKAMAFVNKVAEIANKEDHHPDIKIVYNKVSLDFFTHAVGGLSENDFIMASKINEIRN